MEPSILRTLVKGLYDGDTKSEVLSKVTQMNLEDTGFCRGKGDRQTGRANAWWRSIIRSGQLSASTVKVLEMRSGRPQWLGTGACQEDFLQRFQLNLQELQPGRTLQQCLQETWGQEEQRRGGDSELSKSHA